MQSPYNKGLYLDTYDWLAAFYPQRIISLQHTDKAFDQLAAFHQDKWLIGYLSYSLKADAERVKNTNASYQNFPVLEFAQPGVVIYAKGEEITIEYSEQVLTNPLELIDNIEKNSPPNIGGVPRSGEGVYENQAIQIQPRINREQYIERVQSLQKHIQLGNIYEANFCMEFYTDSAEINPYQTFRKLNAASPMPFAAFVKTGKQYLLCASPERFIKKEGNKVFSQPIKGTAPRGVTEAEDNANAEHLINSEKERAENVMIVDLVRNDISRTAKVGTVKVDELCGVYSLPKVHQMISTISGEVNGRSVFTDVLRNAYPMGSMTGAPKIRAMELIEEHEEMARGLFSGSVGYITPNGDFDFNVVIRSIMYDAELNKLSYWAGSAITAQSVPEQEYDECMLKLGAIRQVLS